MDLDEASYAAIACRLLDGGLPYRDGVENKFPLIFYTYKSIFALFGRYDMHAIHLAVTLSAILTALVCGRIARRFAGERAQFWTTLFYIVYSASFYPKMLAGNTEMFAVLPSALAMWCYLEAREGHPWLFLPAGLFGGVTLLFKQVAGATFAALGADRALEMLRTRSILKPTRDSILLLIGFCIAVGAVALHLRSIGVWDDAYFWTWTYALRHYIPSGTKDHGFAFHLLTSFAPFLLLVSPALIPAIARARRSELLSIWIWFGATMTAALIGGRMYGHYFLLMLPALSTLGGIGAATWLSDDARRRKILTGALAFTATGFFVFACLYDGSSGSFWSPSPDYRPPAEYVRAHTIPTDRIFVWGWYPTYYVATDRCPSTRFVYTIILSGGTASGGTALGHNVPEGWAMLMNDLERDPPSYIVDTSTGDYSFPFPMQNYPALWNFVSSRYRHETTLEGVSLYRRVEKVAVR